MRTTSLNLNLRSSVVVVCSLVVGTVLTVPVSAQTPVGTVVPDVHGNWRGTLSIHGTTSLNPEPITTIYEIWLTAYQTGQNVYIYLSYSSPGAPRITPISVLDNQRTTINDRGVFSFTRLSPVNDLGFCGERYLPRYPRLQVFEDTDILLLDFTEDTDFCGRSHYEARMYREPTS